MSVAQKRGVTFKSFQAAQSDPQGYVIFEADFGGLIYATCPAQLIKYSEETMIHLLNDLCCVDWGIPLSETPVGLEDLVGSECNGVDLLYNRHELGDCVGGSINHSGPADVGLWVADEFIKKGLFSEIEAVLLGCKTRIS